jgi:hypothetical protein
MTEKSYQMINWKSGDKTIQRSLQHTELFIVNHADGTFHAMRSGYDLMQTKYPVNTVAKRSK